jgi:hypothetical protein
MLMMASRGSSEALLTSNELAVVERGAHHRILERVVQRQTARGQIVQEARRIHELGTGMHRLVNGAYVECNNGLELLGGAGVARETSFPVSFAASPNVAGAVDCEAPDGKRFRYTVLGLSIFDRVSGLSVLIAEVQETVGELHPPERVFYPNALVGTLPEFGAFDLFYAVHVHGWEQNVLIRSRIELPAGFNAESSQLECWTEVIEGPEPQKHVRNIGNMQDENFGFGATCIGPGKAFVLDGPGAGNWSAPVAKSWVQDETGRRFIVEAVSWEAIEPHLRQLPPPGQQAALHRNAAMAKVSKDRLIPAQRVTRKASEPMRMAAAAMPRSGLVLDFSQVLSGGSLRLEGDKTYLCSSAVLCTNLTIEGGVVVKYTNNASIELQFPNALTCLTSPYRPAIFTSVFDPYAGETISTNQAPGRQASAVLITHSGNLPELSYLRISYARKGINVDDHGLTIKHSMFTHCDNAMYFDYGSAGVRNCLFYSCSNAFGGYDFTIQGEHLTFNATTNISGSSTETTYLYLTNCIMAEPFELGMGELIPEAVVEGTPEALFQTVGGCKHYLVENSPYRDAGVVNTAIASEIKSKTTYPPIVYPHGSLLINQNVTLTPQAQRDTDTPDLGWHPEAMDFVFGLGLITNATIRVSAGTVVGFYSTEATDCGFGFGHGGRLLAEGSPTNLARFVRYSTVQEIANTNWAGYFGPLIRTPTEDVVPPPEIRFRFTDFSVMAKEAHIVYGDYPVTDMPPLKFADCQVHGGIVETLVPSLVFTNCLFERVATTVVSAYGFPFTNYFQNNLFYGGEVIATPYESTNEITFRDNLFDRTILSGSADVANSYNGYLINSNRLSPNGATDVIVNSITYETGPLSRFYLPTNSVLVNTGSVNNAALKGMYWHSSFTNGTWEGNSQLNIGLMFIAVTNGVAVDSDGEGLASYLEDANGNGTTETTETSFNNIDTDGDGVNDYIEYLQGRNPLTNWVNDANGVINLKVFTPLK